MASGQDSPHHLPCGPESFFFHQFSERAAKQQLRLGCVIKASDCWDGSLEIRDKPRAPEHLQEALCSWLASQSSRGQELAAGGGSAAPWGPGLLKRTSRLLLHAGDGPTEPCLASGHHSELAGWCDGRVQLLGRPAGSPVFRDGTCCARPSQESQSSGVKEPLAAVSAEGGVFPAADSRSGLMGRENTAGTEPQRPPRPPVSARLWEVLQEGARRTRNPFPENRGAT